MTQPSLRVDYNTENEYLSALVSIENYELEAIVSINISDESYEGELISLDFQMIDELNSSVLATISS